jgi:hypothetical protein
MIIYWDFQDYLLGLLGLFTGGESVGQTGFVLGSHLRRECC